MEVLSPTEQRRYTRHILLKEIGGAGQYKLKQAKVLMVGAGGLGAPCLFYLAASGIGKIGIIDDDVIELENLQRQILYQMGDLHSKKASCAQERLSRLNSDIEIIAYPERLTKQNAFHLFSEYDLIADGSDNFKTRFLVNDVCYFAKKPLVSAAIGQFEGQLSSFRSFELDAEGKPNPSWRCFVREALEEPDSCDRGVLGTLCGVLGSLQALEIIKQITGIGDNLLGKVLLYDGLHNRLRVIKLVWDKDNPLNGDHPRIKSTDFNSI